LTKLTNCLTTEEASASYSSQSSEPHFPDVTASYDANSKSTLRDAIDQHRLLEKASFHTPGHKGRVQRHETELATDLTELPGLDDLSSPRGVLAGLNHAASEIWNTRSSLLSINGASAGLIASIMCVASRGQYLLVPRNAHKSVVTGLILSGLEPIWYSPVWNDSWKLFEEVTPAAIEQLFFDTKRRNVAAMVVVSPTYAGAYSDIRALSELCKSHGIALIVDEAHGAHVVGRGSEKEESKKERSAVRGGADVVVHSLHKTLGALTQTGLIQVPHNSEILEANLSHHLNMLQSTSPSYLLMLSIEDALCRISSGEDLSRVRELAMTLRNSVPKSFEVYDTAYSTDEWHVLLRHEQVDSHELFEFLTKRGIYPECELGNGVLLMLGVGSNSDDLNLLTDALIDFQKLAESLSGCDEFRVEIDARSCDTRIKPETIDQILAPRIASLAPSTEILLAEAENFIAAECIAPCPPGTPVCVPGQRLTKEVLNQIPKKNVRVVITKQLESNPT
jgi:arginine/lysine/ornithine decarboxylase